MLVFDGVRAGRIDDVEVLEEVDRNAHLIQRWRDGRGLERIAMLEKEDLVRGGDDSRAGEVLPKKGVEEGGFADVDLADDDEDKGLLEAGKEVVEDDDGLFFGSQFVDQRSQRDQVIAEAGAELEIVIANHPGARKRRAGGSLQQAI